MPNYIKALILVLVATSVVMFFVRDSFGSHYSREQFRSYRNSWWFLTVCLFVAPGIWIFYAIVVLLLLKQRFVRDIDRVSLYCFLLFAAPSVEVNIPGVAGIDSLFGVDLQRLLVLFILLPIFRKSLAGGFSVNPADKFVVLYVLLSSVLLFRGETVTHGVRMSFLLFTDIIVPYFVISRTIKSFDDFNRVLLALMFTLSLVAAEAVIESLRHWELYNSTGHRLIGERIFRYSEQRAGLLRARSIFMSPIILGYAMVFLLALLLYLKPWFTRKAGYRVLVIMAAAALVVSFSRAPWIGCVIFLVIYWALAKGLAKAAVYAVAASVVGIFVLSMTSFGQGILNLLPFFGGTEDAGTFDYRAQLLENGIKVVQQNPLLGRHDFIEAPEMQALRQGQGIIDTVNIYLTIAMRQGLIGLFLFVMIFIPSMLTMYRNIRTLPPADERFSQLGRTLLSFMVASLMIMGTVSNSDFVPVIYYLSVALLSAWLGIYKDQKVEVRHSSELMVRQ